MSAVDPAASGEIATARCPSCGRLHWPHEEEDEDRRPCDNEFHELDPVDPEYHRTTVQRTLRGVSQTIFASEELNALGIYGNCMQAAVATLLGLPMEAVPHFGAFDDWPAALSLWAKGEGLVVKGERTTTIPARRCLVGGTSPRGFGHMVVGEHRTVLWDPHPSRSGLVSVREATWFEPASGRTALSTDPEEGP